MALRIGGGCEITERRRSRLQSERAEFCKAEINLGICAAVGGSQRLRGSSVEARAADDSHREPITASEARSVGLLTTSFSMKTCSTKRFALARKFTEKSPWRSRPVSAA